MGVEAPRSDLTSYALTASDTLEGHAKTCKQEAVQAGLEELWAFCLRVERNTLEVVNMTRPALGTLLGYKRTGT